MDVIGCYTITRAAVIALSKEIHLFRTLCTRGRLVAVIFFLVVIGMALGIIAQLSVLLVVLLMMTRRRVVVLLLLLYGGHNWSMLCVA